MNNKTTSIVVVAVVAVLTIGAVALKNNKAAPAMPGNTMSQTDHKAMASAKPSSDVQETNMVTYKGFDVVQKHIKVKKGTTVTWTNEDSAKHDVTPDTETADFKETELFGKGETKSITFNTVGTFSYHCSPHPYMKGIVEVTE